MNGTECETPCGLTLATTIAKREILFSYAPGVKVWAFASIDGTCELQLLISQMNASI